MGDQVKTAIYPDLQGKRVLVTGGSAGIGKATALAFSKNGAIVTIIARTLSKLEAAVAEFPSKGYYVQGDLTDVEDIRRASREAISKMGGLDILINNGAPGVPDSKTGSHLDVEVLQHMLNIHVVSCMAVMEECQSELIANKGVVVNVSSVLSDVIYVGAIPYCTAKAAQDAMTRAIALHWANLGVRVNSVNPGIVNTEAAEEQAKKMGMSKQELTAKKQSLQPTGQVSEPSHQANVILFLCSDSSTSITGHNLFSDGAIRSTNWFNLSLKNQRKH